MFFWVKYRPLKIWNFQREAKVEHIIAIGTTCSVSCSICFFICFLLKAKNGFANLSKLKNSHREKAPPNETQALTKSMNMDITVVGTLNQLFKRGSYTEVKFSKK